MKKSIFFIVFAAAIFMSQTAKALEFTEGSIRYSTSSSNADEVYIIGAESGVRTLVINDEVSYNGKKYPIVGIGTQAFFANTTLTSVYFRGKNLRKINYMAFKSCTNLSVIEMTSAADNFVIESEAFALCTSMKDFVFPNSVTEIKKNAFQGCSALSLIVLHDVGILADNAFDGTAVQRISWANTNSDFKTRMNADDSLTDDFYKANPFSVVSKTLTQVDTYADVPDYLFNGFSNIKTVSIERGTTKLGFCAFNQCTSLTSLQISGAQDMITFGSYAFNNAPISMVNGGSALNLSQYTPALQEIGAQAFSNAQIKELYLGNNDSSHPLRLGGLAFAGCNKLEKIIVDGTYIENTDNTSIFSGSTATELRFEPKNYNDWKDDFTSVSESMFAQLSGLTTVRLSVAKVGNFMFNKVSTIKTVYISNATSIGKQAFEGCTALIDVNLPSTLTNIEEGAFANTKLSSVTIPSKVTLIGDGAFSSTQLSSVTLPSSLTTIGNYVFMETTIKEVVVPENVTKIGHYPFSSSVVKLTYNAIDAAYTGTSEGNIALNAQDITFGSKVKTIPDNFGYNDFNITSLTFPTSVTSIGEQAFAKTGLPSVVVGGNITTLKNKAFGDCQILKTLTLTSGTNKLPDPGTSFSGTTITKIHSTCNNHDAVVEKWSSVCSNIEMGGTKPAPTFNTAQMDGKGTVEITKAPDCGGECIITAVPNSDMGYSFSRWSDGNTDNPRTLNMFSFDYDMDFYAVFSTSADNITLNITADPVEGATFFVMDQNGAERADHTFLVNTAGTGDQMAFIVPEINSGYEFVEWQYDDLYSHVTEDDATHMLTVVLERREESTMMGPQIVTYFPTDFTLLLRSLSDGVEEVASGQREASPATKVFRNGQVLIIRDGKTYNVLGAEVK